MDHQILAVKVEPQDTLTIPSSCDMNYPLKRQRLKPVVVLPTLAIVKRQRQQEAKEGCRKLNLLKNPKIKMRQNLGLDPTTVAERLKPVGLDLVDQYFTLDQATRESTVSRAFMAATYGGNIQTSIPVISEAFLGRHGMKHFLYMNTDYQPHAPLIPGANGLYLRTSAALELDSTVAFRAFVKVKTNSWQYLGQYEAKPSAPPSLTRHEWTLQEEKVRQTWATEISKRGWGSRVCSRILGRRQLGRQPTHLEVEELVANKEYQVITAQEVMAAYDSGDEQMGIWTLKCVGYDNDFQRQLSGTFPVWIPPPKSSKTKRKFSGKPPQPIASSTNPGSKKRKRANTPDPNLQQEDSDRNSESGEDS